MKRGIKPQLPSVKRERGTYRPYVDENKIEFTPVLSVAGDGMPERPTWLTAAGEETWMDNVSRCVPPLTQSDSIAFGIFCNLVGAIGQAFASGEVPPTAAIAEARKQAEHFGLFGAQSRIGDKRSTTIDQPNPFEKFKRNLDK